MSDLSNLTATAKQQLIEDVKRAVLDSNHLGLLDVAYDRYDTRGGDDGEGCQHNTIGQVIVIHLGP